MFSIIAYIFGLCLILANAQYDRLGTYNIDRTKITVSGVSSGAAMSTQVHVVYSSIISGSASIAGPPYWCSQGSFSFTTSQCMLGTVPISMSTLYNKVSQYASQGLIDNPDNMKNHSAYVFSGLLDVVVSSIKKTQEFYNNYMAGSRIKSVYTLAAVHAQITDNYGYACGILSPVFINNCLYNQAYEIISHLYPNDSIKKPSSMASATGKLIRFDQKEFFPSGTSALIAMEAYAWVYVPNACLTQTCKLHIAFHGCGQAARNLGDIYVKNAEYNTVADANNIIILYPQTDANLANPNACWDWWGYTNGDFANKNGYQMRAIRAMIQRLANI